MKKLLIILVLTIFTLPSFGGEFVGNVNFFLGKKMMNDENDWKPVDEHKEFGILIDFKQKSWPISIAIDLLHSEEDGYIDYYLGKYRTHRINIDSKTNELDIGLKKIGNFDLFHPYIGGGIAFIRAESEYSVSHYLCNYSFKAESEAVGFWVNTGIYASFNRFNLGLDLRYSEAKGEVDFEGYDTGKNIGLGGGHAGLILGFNW